MAGQGQSITAKLREQLLKQRQGLKSGGVLIDNKDLTKLTWRSLPIDPNATEIKLGKDYISIYLEMGPKEKFLSTSPQTWGLKCPVIEALNAKRASLTKDGKEALRKEMRDSKEVWIPGIDQVDPGTAANPNFRILRGKSTVTSQMLDHMLTTASSDEIDDITDVEEGRDVLITKSGAGRDTEWKCKFLDRSPISDDPDYVEAVKAKAPEFDVAEHFYKIDLDAYKAMYTYLTGEEELPEETMEAIAPYCKKDSEDEEDVRPSSKVSSASKTGKTAPAASKASPAAPSRASAPAAAKTAPSRTVASREAPAAPKPLAIGDRVTFKSGDDDVFGTITESTKKDGQPVWKIKDESSPDEGDWSVAKEDVTAAPKKGSTTRSPAPKKGKDEAEDEEEVEDNDEEDEPRDLVLAVDRAEDEEEEKDEADDDAESEGTDDDEEQPPPAKTKPGTKMPPKPGVASGKASSGIRAKIGTGKK